MISKEQLNSINTPFYLVEEEALIKNLKILKDVKDRSGCKILLAQKAFSMFHFYPLISEYLDGTASSGLHEARLGFEEMGKETHIFSPAFTEREIDEILKISDHLVFNSFSQWSQFKDKCINAGKKYGIRVNPEVSTQPNPLYDPCAPGSRLGVTLSQFEAALAADPSVLDGISGLHFHTLCEQNSDALETTLGAFKKRFGMYLEKMEWVNFGGGHHITRADYDVERLVTLINDFKSEFGVQVYLEPGEAIALNAGMLVASVIDIIENAGKIAILDVSAACHMPDVLEMPYRPGIMDSALPGEKPFTYRLGGPTCLAGDVIGDYSFDAPLEIGGRLVFMDMAIYTMVKNNTFNGINLPAIAFVDGSGEVQTIKKFGYSDFKNRLG